MIKRYRFLMLCSLSAIGLLACGHADVIETQAAVKDVEAKVTVCTEPRPQLCTMEYLPVCGSTSTAEKKTYGNGCGACGDAEVISYVDGECK